MTLYVAFDPGLRTGLAVANDNGIQAYHTVHFNDMEDSLLSWLKYWGEYPATVIFEDYRLNPVTAKHVEKIHSKMETVQVIGMIKMWCKTNNIECVEQERNRKLVGYKYWGKKSLSKSNPTNHAYDAAAHLMFWMVQTKKLKVRPT
jgi:hypothetical protein